MYPSDTDTPSACQACGVRLWAVGDDPPHRLVAEDDGEPRWWGASFDFIELGVADTAGIDAEQELPRPRLRIRELLEAQGCIGLEYRAEFSKDHGFHDGSSSMSTSDNESQHTLVFYQSALVSTDPSEEKGRQRRGEKHGIFLEKKHFEQRELGHRGLRGSCLVVCRIHSFENVDRKLWSIRSHKNVVTACFLEVASDSLDEVGGYRSGAKIG